jgi:hypothetical protein
MKRLLTMVALPVVALPVIALSASLAGCSEPAPFYYNHNEFNRSSPTFARDPDDLKEVSVCYAKSSTTPQAVTKMAVDRCAAFGKQAVFRDQDVLNCPMTAPVRAIYDCVAP